MRSGCGLSPLISPGCRILILGSYPSVLSLKAGEYYANPRNMFWNIIESIFSIPLTLPYKERTSLILARNVGLWDVYCSCDRERSADIRIKNPEPNDIRWIISQYPTIEVIFLNGREAEKGFKKFFPDISIATRYLPSSSPAHAVRLSEKIEKWKVINEIN
ncbi:hypothetical protein DSECCO2_62090 [anaerobic digester metagenome]